MLQMDASTSFGSTISGGIQDISALLPLLGTEQCEKHIGSSLNNGFLYAAVTPLSIFGSLGAVKAAFAIGLASIPYTCFFGAKKLKDAGFSLPGEVAPMIVLDGERYLIETCLQSLLEEKHLDNPDRLTIGINNQSSTIHLPSWNISLLICSMFVASFSFIPYLHFIIRHDTSNRRVAWLFPLIRVLGGVLCVVPSQIILQNRILLILNQRILFMRIDRRIKNLEGPFKWGAQFTSEECLWSLHSHLGQHQEERLNCCIEEAFESFLDSPRDASGESDIWIFD
jgi:hypothetical protein